MCTTPAYGETSERSLPRDFPPVGGRSIASNRLDLGVADPGLLIRVARHLRNIISEEMR